MSGITDDAAIEGHDLIHKAEVEEGRVGSPLSPPPTPKLKKMLSLTQLD